MREPLRSYDVAGLKLTPATLGNLVDAVDEAVRERRQCVVASQNVHGILVHARDADVRALHARPETIVHIDGMPLVLLCCCAGIDAGRAHRVTWVDFIGPLLERAERRGWRVFYIGSSPEVFVQALEVVRGRYPNLAIRGHHGYFDDTPDTAEERTIAAAIAAFEPHVVLVGMGMGRQERWVEHHLQALAPASVLTSGACFEYLAGAVRTPPRWMGHYGLEWLFRFGENPQRFAFRYLIEPWIVAGLLLRRFAARRAH